MLQSSKRAILLSCALGLAMAVPSAEAEQHKTGNRVSFSELDANGDGEISQAELEARATKRFNDTDTNGDGVLSRDELQARMSERMLKRVDRMMSRMDSNGDGQISLAEMRDGGRRNPARMLARADLDNSGGISQEEFRQLRGKRRDGAKERRQNGNATE